VLDGLNVVVVPGTGHDSITVTASIPDERAARAVFNDAANVVREHGAHPVSQMVFGATDRFASVMDEAESAFGDMHWPVTWIEGGREIVGTQIMAVRGVDVQPFDLAGRLVGATYEDAVARYAHVGGFCSLDVFGARPDQARQTFDGLQAALEAVGMDFGNVVRTWLYLDDILGWYREFNEVRWTFFAERNVTQNSMPASTGIGAANPLGSAVLASCFAVQPKENSVEVTIVDSPLQCPASDYRSSFSRATELLVGLERRLFVSGTASIAPDGETAHVGDVRAQIALTMEVVGAILASRGMDWPNVTRAIAYFPSLGDAPQLGAYCLERGIPPLPVAITQGVVCRDDLLFEIEVDAVAITGADG
jgi:enamine deaminase RidA (YjgF/YER057c/UK114 family)